MPKAKGKGQPKPKARKTKATAEGLAPAVLPITPRPAHRPTSYDPSFCARVIEYGRMGKSIAWMASELGVAKKTVYNWMGEHEEFLHSIEEAITHSQKWWEDAGQDGIVADRFNGTVWQKNMASRFRDDWTERSETYLSGANGGPVLHSIEYAVVEASD